MKVFEQGGVWASVPEASGWVSLHERADGIDISTGAYTRRLGAIEAKRLARQLIRFASRIETK